MIRLVCLDASEILGHMERIVVAEQSVLKEDENGITFIRNKNP